jgi:predicted acyltransferase
MGAPPSQPGSGRLVSLDAFRGLTIAAMILVNNPGSWGAVYPPLLHAEWHGWTPTDLIFPFFLFIMGVAMLLSFDGRLARGADRADLMRHVLRRSAILFGLGLFMAAYPTFTGWDTIRIMGVLQRIALVYLIASIYYLYLPRWRIWAKGVGILLLYWAAMTLIPVPGFGAGDLSPGHDLGSWIDRTLLGQEHLWRDDPWDPEGLFSTLPAVVTTLLGIAAGRIMTDLSEPRDRLVAMTSAGGVLVTVGYLWGLVFPINKYLWTSSYVLFTGGLAFLFLALCYWTIDVKGWRRWATPAVIYGMNAIAVFVLSGLLTKTLGRIHVGGPDGPSAYSWIYQTVFLTWLSPVNASLAFALSYVGFWLFMMWLLHRRGIFIKI